MQENPSLGCSPDAIPGECGSLPVLRGIVNGGCLPVSYHNRNVPVFSTIEMSRWLWFHVAPEKLIMFLC